MCRFIAYSGPPVLLDDVLYRPSHSIIVQSYRSLERAEPHNGDGFGLGWYDPEIRREPGVFRSIRPAWSNRNIQSLASMIRTRHFFAHVRGAYPGMEVSELNCHPFSFDRFLFMHNGIIMDFDRVRVHHRHILDDEAFGLIRGTTDSEHLFGLFIQNWLRAGRPDAFEEIRKCLVQTIGRILETIGELGLPGPASLNMALSDGEFMLVSRFQTGDDPPPSLYISSGADLRVENGSCEFVPPESGPGSVFIASERFSRHDTWRSIPANHLVSVSADLEVSFEAIEV